MKRNLKNGLYLLCFSLLTSLVIACLGNNGYTDEIPLDDAELIAFSLTSDSVPDLKYVVFSIDQRGGSNGLIYNYDSMAYQTKIEGKVIVNYSSAASTNNMLNITNNDSIWVKSGDSIDITNPVLLKVFSLDGKTSKLYTAQVNIHQVDPDSVQYIPIASDLPFLQTEDTKTIFFNNRFFTYSRIEGKIQLHTSPDAVTWTKENLTGLPENTVIKGILNSKNRIYAYTENGNLYNAYDEFANDWYRVNTEFPVKSILGYLEAGHNQREGLSLVVENGVPVFAFLENPANWVYGAAVPGDFPLHESSNYSYTVMLSERISLFGGVSLDGNVRNSVWSTQNGYYWAKLTNDTRVFPPLKGMNVFYYNQEFWLINGISNEGSFNQLIYYSLDGGITWKTKPEKCQVPETYSNRYAASVVVDADKKHFYIIGGKQTSVLPEIWKGFLNKSEFEH